MGLDIRVPIGMLFSVLGILLTIFGWLSNRSLYARSLGIDINFIWGLALVAFGVIMLMLGRRGMARAHSAKQAAAKASRPPEI
ncbi:MAG TPA: hypothetical protein VNF02_04125 [Candidatus Limnocylindrales bacterium]|nr:hypothetical protein [Candidatus Limnocylindrales bacterium]